MFNSIIFFMNPRQKQTCFSETSSTNQYKHTRHGNLVLRTNQIFASIANQPSSIRLQQETYKQLLDSPTGIANTSRSRRPETGGIKGWICETPRYTTYQTNNSVLPKSVTMPTRPRRLRPHDLGWLGVVLVLHIKRPIDSTRVRNRSQGTAEGMED